MIHAFSTHFEHPNSCVFIHGSVLNTLRMQRRTLTSHGLAAGILFGRYLPRCAVVTSTLMLSGVVQDGVLVTSPPKRAHIVARWPQEYVVGYWFTRPGHDLALSSTTESTLLACQRGEAGTNMPNEPILLTMTDAPTTSTHATIGDTTVRFATQHVQGAEVVRTPDAFGGERAHDFATNTHVCGPAIQRAGWRRLLRDNPHARVRRSKGRTVFDHDGGAVEFVFGREQTGVTGDLDVRTIADLFSYRYGYVQERYEVRE